MKLWIRIKQVLDIRSPTGEYYTLAQLEQIVARQERQLMEYSTRLLKIYGEK